MTSSLVGSEMCIRDRQGAHSCQHITESMCARLTCNNNTDNKYSEEEEDCLLYTSDAADDM
eukprot:1425758-Prorocentrum_lima.AAC.1